MTPYQVVAGRRIVRERASGDVGTSGGGSPGGALVTTASLSAGLRVGRGYGPGAGSRTASTARAMKSPSVRPVFSERAIRLRSIVAANFGSAYRFCTLDGFTSARLFDGRTCEVAWIRPTTASEADRAWSRSDVQRIPVCASPSSLW